MRGENNDKKFLGTTMNMLVVGSYIYIIANGVSL